MYVYAFFFFFKQKTAYEMRISDWSSDVCSSDLLASIDSAAVATTKATDAGNFANAAQAERIAAETARGGSENAAGVATAAAASADDDAALADRKSTRLNSSH